MKTGMRLLTLAAIAALMAGLAGTAFAGAAKLPVLRNVPTRVGGAKVVHKHSASARLSIVVGLRLQNQEQLRAFIASLHDPASPNYHHYLTPAEFTALYGPSEDQVTAVKSFLTSNGIHVQRVSSNRTLIEASATTAVLQRAFGVTINDYKDKNGAFYSASANPSLPAALNNVVLAVMGLDNAVTLTQHLRAPTAAPAASTSVHLGPGGFSPQAMATAYGWPDLTDTTQAQDSTIAIATAYSYSMRDLNHFWDQFGLPHHTVTQTFLPVGQSTRRLNDETTLDIERSSAMSPGSTILVYSGVSPSFVNFDLVFNQIVTDNLAQVISTSWGSPESGSSSEALEDEAFKQAVTQGMTILAAAGDNGAADGSAPGSDVADFPSSDPYVVAAGGTHIVLNNDNTISSEKAWSGAGGADSKQFAEPPYQTGSTGWTSNSSCTADTSGTFDTGDACAGASAPSRQSSDMSMNADPATGMSLFYNGRWAVFGGTSFVAPELAGLFAIAVTRNGGDGLGDGPRLIFCVANSANYSADFNDITTGNNGPSGVFNAGTGWDHPTGWGTPKDASSLASDLVTQAGSCALGELPLNP